MNFYNKAYSCYEELKRYYPRYYLDVLEMQEILKVFGEAADKLENGIETVYKDTLLSEASELSVENLAAWLGLETAGKATEEIRELILLQFLGGGKVSATRIAEAIKAYTGAESSCRLVSYDSAGNNRLEITVERDGVDAIDAADVYDVLAKIIPAHLCVEAIISYAAQSSIYTAIGIAKDFAAAIAEYEKISCTADSIIWLTDTDEVILADADGAMLSVEN